MLAYKTRVLLTVYNEESKEIIKLVDGEKDPGTYEVEFSDVETGHAPSLQSETYFYRLVAGDFTCEKKMVLEK